MSEHRDISLNSIRLNTHNPRIRKADSQFECALRMYNDGKASFDALLKSISLKGFLRGENIIVQRDPSARGKFIVVEGNRRIAALKILHGDKEFVERQDAPSVWLKRSKEFRQDLLDASKNVPCLIFDDSKADHDTMLDEIGVRHANDAPRDDWPPVQRERFVRDHRDKNTPHLELLERFFLEHPGLDDEWSPSYPLTYLQDFMLPLSRHFGYADAWEMANAYPDKATRDTIDRLIKDIYNKESFPELKILENRRSNASQFLQEHYPYSGEKLDTTPKPNFASNQKQDEQSPPKAPQEKSKQPTQSPKLKDPFDLGITELQKLCAQYDPIGNTKLYDVLGELRQLVKNKRFPIASGVLLRCVWDYTLRSACKKLGIEKKGDMPFSWMITKIKEKLNNEVIKNKLDSINNGSMPILHRYVHSPYIIPTQEDLRSEGVAVLQFSTELLTEINTHEAKPKEPSLATQDQAPQG